jgi:hypothetical protein
VPADHGVRLLERVSLDAGVSPELHNLARMRKRDLSSKYRHGTGYESQGHWLCSSMGQETAGLTLSITGHFVVERDCCVAIPNECLPLAARTREKGIPRAGFDETNGRIIASPGFIRTKLVLPPKGSARK